jgi:hypothetical protein
MSNGQETAPSNGGTADKARPPEFDVTVANQARVYDYLLGGKDNYEADRAAVAEQLKIFPGLAFSARANRAFLGRVIRYLTDEAGIRQFLDIGSGIPTAGNAHEVAQAIAPESRVVYVDYDPVVLAHARALLNSHAAGATAYVDADLRDTDTVLRGAGQVLDFTRPVAVTLLAVLHAIPDADDPYAVVATVMDALPSGSYLALTHIGPELVTEATAAGLTDNVRRMSQQQYTPRTREELARLFEGMDLVPPGIVPVEQWRPDTAAAEAGASALWSALGRKR